MNKTKKKSRGKTTLDGLLWPAVAGNVLWSAVTLALADPSDDPVSLGTRFWVLVFLGVYLVVDFVLTEADEAYGLYWTAEILHLFVLSVLAIATGMSAKSLPFLTTWLYVLLGVNVFFNLIGAWDDQQKWNFVGDRELWKWRSAFAAANGAGLVALWMLPRWPDGLQLLIAVGLSTVGYSGVAFWKRWHVASSP